MLRHGVSEDGDLRTTPATVFACRSLRKKNTLWPTGVHNAEIVRHGSQRPEDINRFKHS